VNLSLLVTLTIPNNQRREHYQEIIKIQEDKIILPCRADENYLSRESLSRQNCCLVLASVYWLITKIQNVYYDFAIVFFSPCHKNEKG
jgi:hypothetical protein